jgi:micrococcal nuclease
MKKMLFTFVVFLLLLGCQAMMEERADTGGGVGADEGKVTTGAVARVANLMTGPFDVAKVVDGDTIDVMMNGEKTRVRLIGINTPEVVDPRKPVECFGKEASAHAKDILTGKKVSLESDPTQTDRDKYDRLLRYIFLEDGTNFNESMIREGYAYEYTYDLPYKYQAQFKAAQKEASDAGRGLWAEGVCGG